MRRLRNIMFAVLLVTAIGASSRGVLALGWTGNYWSGYSWEGMCSGEWQCEASTFQTLYSDCITFCFGEEYIRTFDCNWDHTPIDQEPNCWAWCECDPIG